MVKGELGNGANVGLSYWNQPQARGAIGADLWGILLELGFADEAFNTPGTPDFAPYIWRNDPRGLELFEAHHMDPTSLFRADPLTQNVARVYLLTGRGRKLAELYLSLNSSADEFMQICGGSGRFVQIAPMVAMALAQSRHEPEAAELFELATQKGSELAKGGRAEDLADLARVYAAEGRKEDAVALLANAVAKRWMPHAPEFQPDLHSDPVFAGLKGDARFEKLRDAILARIAAERAKVNLNLLRQLSTPADAKEPS
jgi:hypothetical protein